MRFAYADPPYPGCAHRYVEKTEVNHAQLMRQMVEDFPDGWALSTNSTTLAEVLSVCPVKVRIAAWVKPFAVFRPNVNPAYAWEPVLFWKGRKRGRYEPTVRDWFSGNITLKKGLVGAKSPEFCRWILELLGYRYGVDELVDLFPGTGVMGKTTTQSTLWVPDPQAVDKKEAE